MKRKWLAAGIILLFVGIAYAPAMAQNTESSQSTSRGNWLYVGGSGPGNYSRIQDAINDSVNGDTVFVYDDSSPYYENLMIRKSIALRGEDKNTTIIDGRNGRNVTYIHSNNVTISGFTIQHVVELSTIFWCGIWIVGNNCTIEGNIIQNNELGIALSNGVPNLHPCNHRILNNSIRHNKDSGIISFIGGSNITISGNIISDNSACGIVLSGTPNSKCMITRNIITNNDNYGLIILGTFNTITKNTVQNHIRKFRGAGIRIDGINNTITKNNFINNTIQCIQNHRGNLSEMFHELREKNIWDENYWGEPLSEKVRIPGLFIGRWFIPIGSFKGIGFNVIIFPWPTFDTHPAQEPYDIP